MGNTSQTVVPPAFVQVMVEPGGGAVFVEMPLEVAAVVPLVVFGAVVAAVEAVIGVVVVQETLSPVIVQMKPLGKVTVVAPLVVPDDVVVAATAAGIGVVAVVVGVASADALLASQTKIT
jgi:hypothetical protein